MGGKQNNTSLEDVEAQTNEAIEIPVDEAGYISGEDIAEIVDEQEGELIEVPGSETEPEPEFDISPAVDTPSGEVTISNDAHLQEIEALKQTVEESRNQALRAQAELDNVRKRSNRDIESAHKYALEKFMADLLPVLDSMELGISASDNAEDIAALREGMDLTLKMFVDTLEKFGVKVIDPQDEKFNPEQHEAISMQELEGAESGSVISVMQKGYELNGRLIRPAMVIVAK